MEQVLLLPVETAIKTPELIKRLREHLKACQDLESMKWHKNYGKSLAYLRDKKGITLRSMSESMDVSLSNLWRLENGGAKWTEKLAEKYLNALE